MIETITVNRWIGETLDPDPLVLRLTEPALSGFAVISVDGLGASKSNINVDESPSFDGAFFNSSHVNSRTITMNLKYWFDPLVQNEEESLKNPEQRTYASLEQIRQTTYHYLRSKSKVRLTFKTNIRTSYIDGYIESNEADIFSEESGCTISIVCPDPFFYSIYSSTDSMGRRTAESSFEFPFPSKSMLDKYGDGRFEFGYTKDSGRRVYINYKGEVETGAIFKIIYYDDEPFNKTLTIYNTDYKESMVINPDGILKESGHQLRKGDIVEISTLKGNKYVNVIFTDEDDGSYKSIKLGFKSFPKSNKWLSVISGNNTFAYNFEGANGETFPDGVSIEITTRIKYEGI